MSQLDPFQPQQGNSAMLINATTSPVSSTAALTGTAVRVTNGSTTVSVYVAFGSSSITAAAPTTGTPATGAQVLPAMSQIFGVKGSQSWASVISSSAGPSPVTLQAGYGGF